MKLPTQHLLFENCVYSYRGLNAGFRKNDESTVGLTAQVFNTTREGWEEEWEGGLININNKIPIHG